MQCYSPEFKKGLAEQVLFNPKVTVNEVASASGVGRASLFRWVKEYGACVAGIERKKIKPSQWSFAQRIRALIEYQSLAETDQGAYLRKNGLYYSDLAQCSAGGELESIS